MAGWVQAAISRDNADLCGRATVAIRRASSREHANLARRIVSLFSRSRGCAMPDARCASLRCSFVTVSLRDLC